MSPITRGWIAFAAVGAGLIHLALAVSAPTIGALLLIGMGIVEFAWGVLVMFDERFLVPRIAVVAALAPVALWIAALLLGVDAFRPFPLAIATLLELFIAVTIAVVQRRGRSAAAPGTRRYVAGLLAGALVVGIVTAPALGATEAGRQVIDPTVFGPGVHH